MIETNDLVYIQVSQLDFCSIGVIIGGNREHAILR